MLWKYNSTNLDHSLDSHTYLVRDGKTYFLYSNRMKASSHTHPFPFLQIHTATMSLLKVKFALFTFIPVFLTFQYSHSMKHFVGTCPSPVPVQNLNQTEVAGQILPYKYEQFNAWKFLRFTVFRNLVFHPVSRSTLSITIQTSLVKNSTISCLPWMGHGSGITVERKSWTKQLSSNYELCDVTIVF